MATSTMTVSDSKTQNEVYILLESSVAFVLRTKSTVLHRIYLRRPRRFVSHHAHARWNLSNSGNWVAAPAVNRKKGGKSVGGGEGDLGGRHTDACFERHMSRVHGVELMHHDEGDGAPSPGEGE